MEDIVYLVQEYVDEDGWSPFAEWLSSLPVVTRAKIAARLARFEAGNLGDTKGVGPGVYEARIHLGPGYRIYFGLFKGRLILLLNGGSKRAQFKDIKKAQAYWNDWKENN